MQPSCQLKAPSWPTPFALLGASGSEKRPEGNIGMARRILRRHEAVVVSFGGVACEAPSLCFWVRMLQAHPAEIPALCHFSYLCYTPAPLVSLTDKDQLCV
jgi:hypothetical protein